VRAELYLRYSRVPFEKRKAESKIVGRQVLPVLIRGEAAVDEESGIYAYLSKESICNLDFGLTSTEKATSHFIVTTVEKSLFWGIVYFMYADERGWEHTSKFLSQGFFGMISGSIDRRRMVTLLEAHGLAHRTPADVAAIVMRDLLALER
jgi:hypothetical protein